MNIYYYCYNHNKNHIVMTVYFMTWLNKSEEAHKKSVPRGPGGSTVPIRQRRLQILLQLLYANRALAGMRAFGLTSGASWNRAMELRKWALFAREAMASPWPKL
jgi:hypothetical protein